MCSERKGARSLQRSLLSVLISTVVLPISMGFLVLYLNSSAHAATINVTLRYNGQLITNWTSNSASNSSTWIRNNDTGQIISSSPQYIDGVISFQGIPPNSSTYTIQAYIDDVSPFGGFFPGDFYGVGSVTGTFQENAIVDQNLDLSKLIHLSSPVDNLSRVGTIGVYPDYRSPVVFAWDAIPEASRYELLIDTYQHSPSYQRIGNAYNSGPIGTTEPITQPITLAVSQPGQHYEAVIYAYNTSGLFVGSLMINYLNGVGWDYRFRVVSDLAIRGIEPDYGPPSGSQVQGFILSGAGFQTGATVELTNFVTIDSSGNTSVEATSLDVSPTRISGTFDLTGVPTGPYNVVVANPDGQLAVLANGFTVLDTSPPVTTASPAGGTYNKSVTVTLTANEPATIKYSIDGGTNFSDYLGPIALEGTTTLVFFATDAAGNEGSRKTEAYTIDTTLAASISVGNQTQDMILPVTSRFCFPAGTVTYVVDCLTVNHVLKDPEGNPLPPADFLRSYVIGPPDTPGSDVRTYSGCVEVPCDLARFYDVSTLSAGSYNLEVNVSRYFNPPEAQTNFTGSLSASTPVLVASAIQTHIITASVGTPGGHISLGGSIVSGPVKVRDGSTPTFYVIPDLSYVVANVQVDGSSMGAVASYVFPAVTEDHTIAASFIQWVHSGFFPPVDNPPIINKVKAGAAVPVKFGLGGNRGLSIFAPNYPASQKTACGTSDPVDVIEETITAGSSSLSYDAASDRYIYVWKTDKAWAGTCRQLVLKFKDGVVQKANFQFAR